MAMIKTCSTPPIAVPKVSGPVCSFKALQALPLKNCEVAINAWQEGSGDPSPENERPIHGFSEVNATRAGKNLFDFNSLVFANPSSMSLARETPRQWVDNSYCIGVSHNNYANPVGVYEYEILTNGLNVRGAAAYGVNIPLQLPPLSQITVSAESIVNGKIEVAFYGADGTWLSSSSGNYQTKTFTVPVNTKWTVLCFTSVENTSIGQFRNILVEAGSTATPYEPYVTPTIYTIQLGQEVYGAKVDVVNGVEHCTWTAVDMANLTWTSTDTGDFIRWRCTDIKNYNSQGLYVIPTNVMVEQFILTSYSGQAFSEGVGKFRIINGNMYACTADINTKPQGLLAYELTETFDIQLTPTQIETLIGNNTIFADTGDTTVRYIKIGG